MSEVLNVLSIAFEVPVRDDFASQAKTMEAMQSEVDALRVKVTEHMGTAKIAVVRKRPAKVEKPTASLHPTTHGTASAVNKAA